MEKNSGLNGIRNHGLYDTCAALLPTELSSQLGAGHLWVRNILVAGEDTKLIYEIHIFELRNNVQFWLFFRFSQLLKLSTLLRWSIICLKCYSTVQIYEFRIFTSYLLHLPVYYELANDQLPVGVIVQLIRALHWYRRGHGFDSRLSLNFSRFYFLNCLSWVHNCDDLSFFGNEFHIFTSYLEICLLWDIHEIFRKKIEIYRTFSEIIRIDF